jgi:stage II sporulation protein D
MTTTAGDRMDRTPPGPARRTRAVRNRLGVPNVTTVEIPEHPPLLRRVWPWSMLGISVLALMLVGSLLFASCDFKPKETYYEQTVTPAGVPILRVLLTAEATHDVALGTTAAYELFLNGQPIKSTLWKLSARPLTRRGGQWLFEGKYLGDGELILLCDKGYVSLNGTTYRGELRFVSRGDNAFLAINYVDMEGYLAGVLSKELYPSWETETYRTQAIAARSFAMYQHDTFGRTHQYDLGSTTASQVYGGVDGETDRSRQAVRDTWGQVLVVGPPGKEKSFLTQYSSTCGGYVNGAHVIRDASKIEPLAGGQACHDCSASSKYRWPAARVTKADIYRAVAKAYPGPSASLGGGVKTVIVKDRTPYGRAIWVAIVGTSGKSITIRAEDLRLAIMRADADKDGSLYSMNCDITDTGSTITFSNGRGFGHGVGLCQWGAQGKAKRGWSHQQILQFYYPGSRIVPLY